MLHKVFYTDRFVAARFGAQTYGPFIFIRPKYKGDTGLLEHEKTHVRQFWRNPLFGLWYWLSKESRLKYELEAFKVQLVYHPENLDKYADLLSRNYDLRITKEHARKLLVE